MILRKRSVELLTGPQLGAGLRDVAHHVVVIGDLPWTAVALRHHHSPVMSIGASRGSVLRRLRDRIGAQVGDAPVESLEPRLSG